MKRIILASALLFSTLVVSAQNKKDEKPPVPLSFGIMEKCLYLDIDTTIKILSASGFVQNTDDKHIKEVADLWKPNKIVIMNKEKEELVIVYDRVSVFHLALHMPSSDKTGDDLFAQSIKAGYKETTTMTDNPRVTRNGKKDVKYNTKNKPWVFELNGKR
ncbi:MAG TPA: hypothetical protein VI112_15245 [Bacteroidia bacterium]